MKPKNGHMLKGGHILVLYTSGVDRHMVPCSLFAASGDGEVNVYLTDEDPDDVRKRLLPYDGPVIVLKPKDMDGICEKGRLNVCVDGIPCSGLPPGLTGGNNTIVCMYDLSRLEPGMLKSLVESHDRLILNTPERTMLSSKSITSPGIDDRMVERMVKEYLDIVILAFIAREPACGKDILDFIQKNFNVLLSPGTLYPLLHKLKTEGYLECEAGIKKKVYRPAKGSERDIRRRLEEHRLACDLMKGFLDSRGV